VELVMARACTNNSQEHCVTDRPTRQYLYDLIGKNKSSRTAHADLLQHLAQDLVGR
jgi:hypothetical protein